MLGIFPWVLSSDFLFKIISQVRNIIWGIPSELQTDWSQIRPDVLSGLIWVQTVCKCYQQTTPAGRELKPLCHGRLTILHNFWYNPIYNFWSFRVVTIRIIINRQLCGLFCGFHVWIKTPIAEHMAKICINGHLIKTNRHAMKYDKTCPFPLSHSLSNFNSLHAGETRKRVIWQTVKTLMQCHKLWHFISVCTVC